MSPKPFTASVWRWPRSVLMTWYEAGIEVKGGYTRAIYTTPPPEVNAVLEFLLAGMQRVLGETLLGVYLFGSLVHGDFEPERSDLDVVAVLTLELDPSRFAALDALHREIVQRFPQWTERLEVKYLSSASLKRFRTEPYPIAVISPGEPFHQFEGGRRFLLNFYEVRQGGATLHGPPPATLIAPISRAEFIEVVQEEVQGWTVWIAEMHSVGSLGYGVVTLCRALYTCTTGAQTSKPQALAWAINALPEFGPLLEWAWKGYRANDSSTPSPARAADVERFVKEVAHKVALLQSQDVF